MKTEYLYVKVNRNGESWKVGDPGLKKINLPELLADGWRPLRETAFGQDNEILICLERDPQGQVGFGFGH